jgi:hypothetical protein
MSNNGKVILISNFHDELSTNIEVWGCIFDLAEGIKNFKQRVIFPDESKKDIHKIIDVKEEHLKNLLEIEETSQERLPRNFRDAEKINYF